MDLFAVVLLAVGFVSSVYACARVEAAHLEIRKLQEANRILSEAIVTLSGVSRSHTARFRDVLGIEVKR